MRILLPWLAAGLALGLTGCANRIVGNNLTERGEWHGEFGLTGHLNHITISGQSRLTRMSIIGDSNTIDVQHGATLGKIEIWGQRNKVYIPEDLIIRSSDVGANQVIRRAPGEPLELPKFEPETVTSEEAAPAEQP